jgi:glycosyltransferase involved in cell wall biosynthesis
MTRKPKVSLGLPVYNGENYLLEAIGAVLAQTFDDYELIISDNGSTDATQAICQKILTEHPQIIYFRSDKNHGASWNFNRVFELASGKYFKWVAHDDLMAPSFLTACVSVLDQEESIILCYPKAKVIDSEGKVIQNYDVKLATDSERVGNRVRDLVLSGHLCYEIFGLIRSEALRKTPLLGGYGHSDGVLLTRLAIQGKFHEIPKYLFFPRQHQKQSMGVYTSGHASGRPDYYNYTQWFDTSKRGKIILPNWIILREYFSTVFKATIPLKERFSCLWTIARWTKRHFSFLYQDLIMAGKQITRHQKHTHKEPKGMKD